MNYVIKQKTWIFTIALIVLAISSACIITSLSSGENTAPEGTPASGGIPEASNEFGSGSFNLDDPAVGLANLSSYRSTLTIAFDGQLNGQVEQWSRSYELTASQQDPKFRQVTVVVTGEVNGEIPPKRFLAETNGVRYEQVGADDCQAKSSENAQPLGALFEPAQNLPPFWGAEAAGTQDVNGVVADHYTFDANALGNAELTQTSGDVWVASDGGYVLKYTSTTQAGPDYFGEGMTGTMTWAYALADINQPVALSLPASCPLGLVDAPLMQDATDIEQDPGQTAFTTTSAIPDVMAFYQDQLVTAGWTSDFDPTISDQMGLAIFTKGDLQLTLTVASTDAGSRVWLILGQKVEIAPE